ncbi:MAG TPA: alpha-ketoglutarate-dependent dioxygenase AlkB [Candidatus Baltobacteraceae bacterium]|jgi:alkylated DNA repair dioxygenase AlkB
MAQQIDLFASGPRVITDGARGTIAYAPHVFDSTESARLFDAILRDSPWSRETMWMYDKMVDVPRLVARFMPEDALPEALQIVKSRVESQLGTQFNAIGLNYYRDGGDSVAWHNDRNEELVALPTVAVLSLGATRQMLVRPKAPPRKAIACDLEPGSLFVMSGRAQEFWEHSIPKSRRPTGPRISIALRQRATA